MIIKFNDQNGCTKEDIREFMKLDYPNKLFFTVKDWNIEGTAITVKLRQAFEKGHVLASYELFGKSSFFDVNAFINRMK